MRRLLAWALSMLGVPVSKKFARDWVSAWRRGACDAVAKVWSPGNSFEERRKANNERSKTHANVRHDLTSGENFELQRKSPFRPDALSG